MSGLFDKLMDQSGDDNDKKSSGLTPLDIAGLPDAQRRVMLTLLRDKEASLNGLTQEALAEKLEHPDNLSDILAELAENNWVIEIEDPPDIRYKINLARKRGRTRNMWAAISDRLGDDSGSQATSANQSTSHDDQGADNHDDESTPSDDKPRRPRFPDISNW